MRAVLQRVSRAQVTVEGEVVGAIGPGLVVLVAALEGDGPSQARTLAKKVTSCRIFADSDDKMNLSVAELGGQVLAISQFTLAGDTRKGNRPSFVRALEPGAARPLFDEFCTEIHQLGVQVERGRFRAHMEVELVNDGPVTILLDTERAF